MQLERHGLKVVTPEIGVTALSPDGRALRLYNDAQTGRAGDCRLLTKRCSAISGVAGVTRQDRPRDWRSPEACRRPTLTIPAALISGPCSKPDEACASWARKICIACCAGDQWLWPILWRSFLKPSCLRAVVAARGIFGTALGPWSAGSSLVLLIRAAGDSHPAGSASFAIGGAGAITQAMAAAAQEAGAEIRTNRRCKRSPRERRHSYGSSSWPVAKRSTLKPSSLTLIPGARCSSWLIPRT